MSEQIMAGKQHVLALRARARERESESERERGREVAAKASPESPL